MNNNIYKLLYFPSGKNATVEYTHAHAYGNDDIYNWVILNSKGKIFSRKPDIFEQVYEPVN